MDFKSRQQAFHNELNNTYESIGKAIDPEKFTKSYNKNLKEWTLELGKYGVETITVGLSSYVLLANDLSTSLEYFTKLGEVGITMLGGYSIIKNINKDTNRKYCRQYLTELKNI